MTDAALPVLLFIGWDETISSHDTLSLIAPPEGTHPGPPFHEYGDAYMADLKAHEESYADQQCSTLSAQLQFLASLDDIEIKSQERIEKGRLFVGFDPVAMEQRGRDHVKLRKGWKEMTTESEVLQGLEYHIVSVGWSGRFIEACLQGSTSKPTSICVNEIEIDPKTGKGTGKLSKSNDVGECDGKFGMRIAQHKTREMKRIVGDRRDKVVAVFAGDSNTDLPCLLDADVGMILGDNKGLRATISKLGLDANLSKSVQEWKEKRSKGITSKPDLVIVEDWFKGAEVIQTLRNH
jgi:hypothetical protein